MVVPDPSTWLNIRGYYYDDLVDMLLWHLNRPHSDKPQCEQCPTNWPPNTSIWLRICWRGLVSYWRAISTVTWGWTVWMVPWRELSLSLHLSCPFSFCLCLSLSLALRFSLVAAAGFAGSSLQKFSLSRPIRLSEDLRLTKAFRSNSLSCHNNNNKIYMKCKWRVREWVVSCLLRMIEEKQ